MDVRPRYCDFPSDHLRSHKSHRRHDSTAFAVLVHFDVGVDLSGVAALAVEYLMTGRVDGASDCPRIRQHGEVLRALQHRASVVCSQIALTAASLLAPGEIVGIEGLHIEGLESWNGSRDDADQILGDAPDAELDDYPAEVG